MSINPDIGPVIDQKNESLRLANLVIDSKRSDGISTSDRASVMMPVLCVICSMAIQEKGAKASARPRHDQEVEWTPGTE